MERLLVFEDFDWLDKPELVGELCYEILMTIYHFSMFLLGNFRIKT